MSPTGHAVVSAGAAAVTAIALRSWSAGAACFLAGVLVDLDHYVDFWMNHGLVLSPRRFFEFCYYGDSPTFVDLLHGYEYIPPLLWLCTVPGMRDVGIGLTVGYSLHLLCDQLFNRHLHRWTYFLAYRAFHRFDSKRIVLFNPFVGEAKGPVAGS